MWKGYLYRHILLLARQLIMPIMLLILTCAEGKTSPLPSSEAYTVTLTETVSVSFKLTIPDSSASFSTLLMSIKRGNTSLLSLIFDHRPGDLSSLTFVGNNAVNTIKSEKILKSLPTTTVTALIRSSDDSFTLAMADTVLVITGFDFTKGGKYKITILPEITSNYDALGNPQIIAKDVEIRGDISAKVSYTEIFLLLLLVLADILLFVYLHFRKKARKRRENREKPGQITISNVELARQDVFHTSTVKLFGGFSIYSANGEELSKLFSPILKELFLLLLCKQSDAGISSSKLKEILWFDKSDESARNNRSVYITKLRQILDRVGSHEISSASGSWKIDMKVISVDFIIFNDIVCKSTITEKDVADLISIVRPGTLLPECDYQWLDEIKARTTDCAITILSNYAEHLEVRERPDLVSSIADALFVLDPVSDIALSYKCKYFIHTGKGYLAKQLYTNFLKDYKNIYGEDYSKTYSDIIIEKPE